MDNEDEEEEGEGGPEPNCAPNPYQMLPPPEGCCTTDGEPVSWVAPLLSEPVAMCSGVPGPCWARGCELCPAGSCRHALPCQHTGCATPCSRSGSQPPATLWTASSLQRDLDPKGHFATLVG